MLERRFPLTAQALKRHEMQLTKEEAERLLDFFDIPAADEDTWLSEWVTDDPANMLRALKAMSPGKSDFDILKSHPRFQSLGIPVDEKAVRKNRRKAMDKVTLPKSLSGLEARRQRGMVNRVICTITLDPIVIRLLRLASKITGRRISYMLEDAFVESKSFYESIEIVITKISPSSIDRAKG